MRTILISFLMLGGTLFVLVAALGVARMPDLYMRLQALGKAASLGVGGVLGAAAVAFWDAEVTARFLLAIVFVIVTTPVATQLIAQAALACGVPLWSGTRFNEYVPRERPPE